MVHLVNYWEIHYFDLEFYFLWNFLWAPLPLAVWNVRSHSSHGYVVGAVWFWFWSSTSEELGVGAWLTESRRVDTRPWTLMWPFRLGADGKVMLHWLHWNLCVGAVGGGIELTGGVLLAGAGETRDTAGAITGSVEDSKTGREATEEVFFAAEKLYH